jgi:hypothetical protein
MSFAYPLWWRILMWVSWIGVLLLAVAGQLMLGRRLIARRRRS